MHSKKNGAQALLWYLHQLEDFIPLFCPLSLRQFKSNSPKKLGFFLEKYSLYIIIYSKVSNFEVYKGGFCNVCWKRKRIKTIK